MNDVLKNREACRSVEEHLSGYIDGVLDEKTRAGVEEHLRNCDKCRKTLDGLKALVQEIGSLGSVPAPADFLESVHERIEKRHGFARFLHRVFFPIRIKIPIQMAAAATAGLLVFAVYHNMLGVKTPPVETAKTGHLEMAETRPPEPAKPSARPRAEEREKPRLMTAGVAEDGVAEDGVAEDGVAENGIADEMKESPSIRLALLIEPAREGSEGTLLDQAPADTEEAVSRERTIAPKAEAPKAIGKAGRALASKALVAGKPKKDGAAVPAGAGAAPAGAGAVFREEAEEPKPRALSDPFSRIKAMVIESGGQIKRVEYDPETGRPRSLSAAIPSARINTLYQGLGRIGTLKSPPPTIPADQQQRVQIEIQFLYQP
jgi:anti-sigma factor RsiW